MVFSAASNRSCVIPWPRTVCGTLSVWASAGVRPGEAEPQACSIRWGPRPAAPSPSCEPEREAPGKEAKAPGDLWKAEPSAVPLLQRFQTPAGDCTGPQPGPAIFWAKTTPILSSFTIFLGTVGTDDLRYLFPPSGEDGRPHRWGRKAPATSPSPTGLNQRARPSPSSEPGVGAGLIRFLRLSRTLCY